MYDGSGTLYDANGAVKYKGEFLLGQYHGAGTLYDSATGQVVEEGEFREGVLVTPSQEPEEETAQEEKSSEEVSEENQSDTQQDSAEEKTNDG